MDIPINERLILSLYDNTGNWAKPYIKAGYPTMLFDKQHEGDITDFEVVEDWIRGYEHRVYGILAAPPCDDFASSGARWWKDKDKARIDNSILLVSMVLTFVEVCRAYQDHDGTLHFWALENPVGRIERMVPQLKGLRRLAFDPADYGDPYTKKTILWGEFNADLEKTPVLPLYGSAMHNMSSNAKAKRSATPMGFAKAFFNANQ